MGKVVPSRQSVKGRAACLTGTEPGPVQQRPRSPCQPLLPCLQPAKAAAERGQDCKGEDTRQQEGRNLRRAPGSHEDSRAMAGWEGLGQAAG